MTSRGILLLDDFIKAQWLSGVGGIPTRVKAVGQDERCKHGHRVLTTSQDNITGGNSKQINDKKIGVIKIKGQDCELRE